MSDVLKPVDNQEYVEVNRSASGRVVSKREYRDRGTERQRMIGKVNAFILILTAMLQMLLGFRFILKLMAANPANVFASFVYAFSDLFLFPFNTLIANPGAEGGFVLEVTTLIGMAVYALIAWLITRLIVIIFSQVSTRDVSVVEAE